MQLRDVEMEKRDPRTVVAIILGGGAGTRLFPLTKRRAKPAVHFDYLPNHICVYVCDTKFVFVGSNWRCIQVD